MINCDEYRKKNVPTAQSNHRATISEKERGKIIMSVLLKHGYTKEQVIGMCSCIYGESSWNPLAINNKNVEGDDCKGYARNGTGAGGICQWLPGCNERGRQKDGVVFINSKYSKNYSINVWDKKKNIWHNNFGDVPLEYQVEFLVHELNGTESNANKYIKASKDAETACIEMVRKFERPGDSVSNSHYTRYLSFIRKLFDELFPNS